MRAILSFLFLIGISTAFALAADEDPVPAPLKPLLQKITAGMSREQVREILAPSYPNLTQQDGPWEGQGGFLGFRLDARYAIIVSAVLDAGKREVISPNHHFSIFDYVREIRCDLHPTGGGDYKISSFDWGKASRENSRGK